MRTEFKDPVVRLYSRRAGANAAYWLSVFGYNVRDRSINNWLYLVYFCGFWGIWILLMFFLVGYILNISLSTLGSITLLGQSAFFTTYLLIGWAAFQLWALAQRSPFTFSEEDAYLLCQTPVSRRTVGMVRFFMGWPGTALIFTGLVSAITFTLVESSLPAGPSLLLIGRYFSASLHSLGILLPLQMGLQAILWGIGALRISPPAQRQVGIQRGLRGSALLIGLFTLGSFLFPGFRSVFLQPLSLPLQAAFGENPAMITWLGGFIVSLAWLGTGLILLRITTKHISLNQAARETKIPLAIRTARSLMSFDLADAMVQEQRMEPRHAIGNLPMGLSSRTLVWKDGIQSLRSTRLGDIFSWGLLFLWSAAMFSSNNWIVQLATATTWVIQAGSLITRRARRDITCWWSFRSLPLRMTDKVRAEITLPVIGVTLLGWLAVALSGRPLIPSIAAGVLLPLLAVNGALSSLHDIFQHIETRLLMTPAIAEENIPQPSTEGLLSLVAVTLVPFAMLIWQLAHPAHPFAGLLGVFLAAGISILLGRSVRAASRWIE